MSHLVTLNVENNYNSDTDLSAAVEVHAGKNSTTKCPLFCVCGCVMCAEKLPLETMTAACESGEVVQRARKLTWLGRGLVLIVFGIVAGLLMVISMVSRRIKILWLVLSRRSVRIKSALCVLLLSACIRSVVR